MPDFRRPTLRFMAGLILAGSPLVLSGSILQGQESSIVAVDESPTASLLIQRMLDQSEDNVGEAARVAADLLANYGSRLVPASDEDVDQFTTVRARVEGVLLARPDLLSRFRQLQGPTADRLFEAGRLEEVVATGWLTTAGLKASLVLAQAELESGHSAHALQRLQRLTVHPDLSGSEAAHHLLMLGIAAHLQGQDALAQQASNELGELAKWDDLHMRLEAIRQNLDPIAREGIGVLDVHEVPAPIAQSWHSVWSSELETSAFAKSRRNRLETSLSGTRLLENERLGAATLTAIPLVVDDVVFVNDGTTVRSFDRFGAKEGWSTDISRGPDRRSGYIVDLGELSLEGDTLVALSGFGFSTGRTDGGAIIGLDLATGKELWRTRIDGLDVPVEDGVENESLAPELDLNGAFPYSGPITSGGTAVVAARKVNSRRETVLYLVGLDVETGEPQWVRMLGSSGGVRTQRGFSRPIEHDGSVIVASPVGVVARVDIMSGEPLWLRRFVVPLSQSDFGLPPWEISQPAVIGTDLYMIAPDGRDIFRIDINTGELLEQWPTGPGTTWGLVRYLIADENAPGGGAIYAVGEDVIAFSAKMPGIPRWRFSETARDEIGSRVGSSTRNGTRGRVHVAGDRLVVPGVEDVLIVDSTDGRVLERVVTMGASNPVLLESQLVLGGLDHVDSLMQLGPAERLLRARIEESPEDPSRALGLLELGLQSKRPTLALEAAETAIGALQTTGPEDPTRETLVKMLLRLQEMTIASQPEVAARTIELAGEVARTPEQRAVVLLALGDLYAEAGQFEDAVDTWFRILSDPILAEVLVPSENLLRRAHLMVKDRMYSGSSADESVFAAHAERVAASALEELEDGTALELEEVARRYGSTPSARDAWIQAAAQHENDGRMNEAAEAILAAVRARPWDGSLRLDAAAVLLRANWPLDATLLLERGYEEEALRPEIEKVLSDNGRSSYLASNSWPQIGIEPGDAVEYPGRLLNAPLRRCSRSVAGPGASLLSIIDRTLQYRASPGDLDPAWSLEVPDRDPAVLYRDAEVAMIWMQPSIENPLAVLLSIEDGSELWRTPPIEATLPPITLASVGRGGRQGMMPGGGAFQPQFIIPVLTDDSLILVRRAGDVASVGIDRDAEVGSLRWTTHTGLDRIYEIASTDRVMAIGGAVRTADSLGVSDKPGIVVLDLDTGRRIGAFVPSSSESIRWLELTPNGQILVGTRNSVEAFPLMGNGAPLWTNNSPQGSGTIEVRLHGDRLIAARAGGTLVAFDIEDGEIIPGAFVLSDSASWLPSGLVSMETDSEGLSALFDERLVRFDSSGAVIGVDALGGQRTFVGHLSTQDEEFIVDERPRSVRDGSYQYWIHRLSREHGCRIAGRSLELTLPDRRLDRLDAVDDWILLSTGTEIIAIPIPEATAEVRSEPDALQEG